MGVLTVVLYALVIVVALMLIGLILIQQSKGGGFGGSFGGVGESVFGAHAGSHITKLTVILTTIFFLVALVLAVLVARGTQSGSVAELALAASAKPAKQIQKVEENSKTAMKNIEKAAAAETQAQVTK